MKKILMKLRRNEITVNDAVVLLQNHCVSKEDHLKECEKHIKLKRDFKKIKAIVNQYN